MKNIMIYIFYQIKTRKNWRKITRFLEWKTEKSKRIKIQKDLSLLHKNKVKKKKKQVLNECIKICISKI